MPENVDIIIRNIGQLITCASGGKPKRGRAMLDVGIIENGGVAVAEGRIVGVGKSDDILMKCNADQDIDAVGRVVCPGFDGYRTPLFPFTPIFFLTITAVVVFFVALRNPFNIAVGAVVVLLGIPVYYLMFRRQSNDSSVNDS